MIIIGALLFIGPKGYKCQSIVSGCVFHVCTTKKLFKANWNTLFFTNPNFYAPLSRIINAGGKHLGNV
jgi:hypothetical protein